MVVICSRSETDLLYSLRQAAAAEVVAARHPQAAVSQEHSRVRRPAGHCRCWRRRRIAAQLAHFSRGADPRLRLLPQPQLALRVAAPHPQAAVRRDRSSMAARHIVTCKQPDLLHGFLGRIWSSDPLIQLVSTLRFHISFDKLAFLQSLTGLLDGQRVSSFLPDQVPPAATATTWLASCENGHSLSGAMDLPWCRHGALLARLPLESMTWPSQVRMTAKSSAQETSL